MTKPSSPSESGAHGANEAPIEVDVEVEVEVEVPRFAFVKRFADGSVDFVSPLPTPFNYGAVPGSRAPDGDRLDVVLLGPRRPAGTRLRGPVRGVVHFVDAGEDDPKLVVGSLPPTRGDIARIKAFFSTYARAKALLNRARGRDGPTHVASVQIPAERELLMRWLEP